MDATHRTTINVLMFPWLAHGHISPFLELAKKLSARNFKTYLCSSPINLSSIKPQITEKYASSIELIELHLPSLLELPPHFHTTKNLPSHLMGTLKEAFDLSEPSFAQILKTLKPDILIYDFLQPWAPTIATSLGIPCVNFITSSGTMTTFMNHLYKDPSVDFPFEKSIYFRPHDRVDISHLLLPPPRDLPKDKFRNFECLEMSNDIVLIKSFKEVEGKHIDYLTGLVGKKVLPVPLVQDFNVKEEEGEKKFIDWLDKKEKSSTVFVSFGTEYFLSGDEIVEIALGLEQSGVNFIWVLKFPTGSSQTLEKALPLGFLERVGERGMVTEGWAPQVRILQHESIGGFVSHCGWSSVMESMKIGVPIIAIPMHIDQPVNARLVEEVGVGVEVVRGKSGYYRDEVERVVKEVVHGKAGLKKAIELSEILKMKGEEDIDMVVQELVKLYLKDKKKVQAHE